MGFLMGALTLLASAIITGGVGPWLPYQMFTAGWVGLTAPLCRPVVRWLGGPGTRAEIVVLALFGGYWGLLFGAIMNIWFWPFAMGPAAMYWEPGIGCGRQCSATWSSISPRHSCGTWRGWSGTALLILLAGAPVLRVLRRFQQRFVFVYTPEGRGAVATRAREGRETSLATPNG